MDKRLKLKEFRAFIVALKADHKHSEVVSKKKKRQAYLRYIKLLFITIWNAITAPIVYPIWYLLREPICRIIYKNHYWIEIVTLIEQNQISTVKDIVKSQSRNPLIYWLWTYGDMRDPLGYGELTDTGIENTFLNRWWENGFRNPRFTVNFLDFRTESIIKFHTVIDTRNQKHMHKSTGIGDSPDGVYFKWALAKDGKWWFIYENNNSDCLFYFGSVGMLKSTIGVSGRFETGYRQTESSYFKK